MSTVGNSLCASRLYLRARSYLQGNSAVSEGTLLRHFFFNSYCLRRRKPNESQQTPLYLRPLFLFLCIVCTNFYSKVFLNVFSSFRNVLFTVENTDPKVRYETPKNDHYIYVVFILTVMLIITCDYSEFYKLLQYPSAQSQRSAPQKNLI